MEKLGAKQLTSHLRSFCDLVVNEFNKSGTEAGHLSKRINAITSMIWKYNIIPPDKLMLCLVLRTYEGNKSHVSLSTLASLVGGGQVGFTFQRYVFRIVCCFSKCKNLLDSHGSGLCDLRFLLITRFTLFTPLGCQ